ncbi:hypothetical protein [Dermatobacter hominis]|uniref:hypothetical protein n=1 Tax=Dermatobacter hominis TaxID=2884263 RepID=UPI001D106A02|nr:hypothetical protein [Dermatobacter hominis]UDY37609.1 hypothetical protein LH044_08730 [Dermatobacter hominis]
MRLRIPAVRSVAVAALIGALLLLTTACSPPPPAPAPPAIDRFTVTASGLSAPALVPFTWSVQDPNGDALTCRFDGDGDGVWDDATTPCRSTSGRTATTGAGPHTARLEVSDGTHPAVTATTTYDVAPGPAESFDVVTRSVGPQDARVTAAVAEAVDRWTAVISRGIPDTDVQFQQGDCLAEVPSLSGVVDDLVLDVIVTPLPGLMGDATWCVVGDDGLPRLSVVRISTIGLDHLYETGALEDVVTHEVGHALGLGTVGPWGMLTRYSDETGAYRFTGPRAVAEWQHLGGIGDTVPLSHDASHWDETSLQDELMTCYVEVAPAHPMSAISVAALADLGFHVEISNADAWAVPSRPGLMEC